jgi:hypothetical protein
MKVYTKFYYNFVKQHVVYGNLCRFSRPGISIAAQNGPGL